MTLEDGNQYFCEAWSCELVRQLFEGATFVYDLHLSHSRDHLKGITEEYTSEKGLHHLFGYGVP